MKDFTRKRCYLLIAGIYLLIFLPIMFMRFPDARNELKYFVVIDDMIKSGNFLIMKYLGELYPDKPPIYFWLLIFLKRNFNSLFYPLALICGSMIPAMFINFIGFRLFSKIRSNKESLIISTSLAALPYFLGASAVLRMDMMMSLFITGALYLFYTVYFGLSENKSWKTYLMYALMGIAILVKGGGGFAAPFSAMVTLLLLEKNVKYLKKIHFTKGLLIIIGIVGIWLGALFIQPEGKEYVSLLLGQETLGRALKSKAHVRPFYYYIKMLPLTLFPFTLFFLGALYSSFKDIKNFKNWDVLEKISFSWFLGPFIFFSLMSGKLDIYLLPIYPGVIALTYCFIFKNKDKKIIKTLFYATLGIILAAVLASNFMLKKLDGILVLKDTIFLSLTVGGAVLAGIYYNRKNNFYKTISSLIAALLLIFETSTFLMENLNDKTTLSPVINYVNSTPYNYSKVIMYRFDDGINMKTKVQKEIVTVNNISELKEEPSLIISREKYKKDLKGYKEVFFNNEYSIFLKNL